MARQLEGKRVNGNSETNTAITSVGRKKTARDRRSTRRRFSLPKGATRSPDAAWISQVRLAGHDGGAREVHSSLPDFVIENPLTNRPFMPTLLTQMQEYIDNGAQLVGCSSLKARPCLCISYATPGRES